MDKKTKIPVSREILADMETPLSVYRKLANSAYSYLFESVEGGEKWARYSLIGLSSKRGIKIIENEINIFEAGELIENFSSEDPLDFIDELQRSYTLVEDPELPPFNGGLVGYFSYDVIRYIEKIPNNCKDDLKIPDVRLSRPKNLIIYDNVKKKIFYVENVYADAKIKNYEEEYHAINKRFDLYEDFENIKLPEQFSFKPNKNLIKSNTSKEKFKSLVKKAKTYIEKGDIFQVVLSQRFERKINKTPIEIYNHLRKSNPSPFMFYFNYKDFNILGSSPEILVRLRGGEVTIRPIAGTRPRGKNSKEDKKYELDLLKDKKELAEHLMLLDLGRNDVGKVSKVNTVKVTEKFKVERYSHVMHIVSNVIGKFNNKFSLFELSLIHI